MPDLKEALKVVIQQFARLEEDHYQNIQPLSNFQKQQIEAHFITIISQYLTQSGPEHENINKHLKKLRLYFHPDKYLTTDAEFRWFIDSLNQGNNDSCFLLIDKCAEEIKNPSTIETEDYSEFYDIEALLKNFYLKKELSTLLTQRALIDSIISLLQSLQRYNHTTEQLGAGLIAKILYSMPFISSGFCVGLYIKELALLYGLTFTLRKGGAWLAGSDSLFWKSVGSNMELIGTALLSSASTLVSYFISFNLNVLDAVYYVGIKACSSIYRALTEAPRNEGLPREFFASSTRARPSTRTTTLTLAPHHFLGGKQFKTYELKLLAMNLEEYQQYQSRQLLSYYRYGFYKSASMEKVLIKMQAIDEEPISAEMKMIKTKLLIDKLCKDTDINAEGSEAAKALLRLRVTYKRLTYKEEDRQMDATYGQSLF